MFTKRRVLLSGLFAAVLALTACTTPRVRSDVDSRVNLANYHTYDWGPIGDPGTAGGPAFGNPLNYKRLRAAVDANLARQGLQPVADGATPDCIVAVAIGSRQVLEDYDRVPVRVGMGWGWRHPGWVGGFDWSTDGVYSYREGRVAVDLFDAKTHEPIWHASVDQDLSYLTGDDAEARINAVVAAMFTKFPGAVKP